MIILCYLSLCACAWCGVNALTHAYAPEITTPVCSYARGAARQGHRKQGGWFPPSFSVSMVTLSCPARICVSGAEMGFRGGVEGLQNLEKITMVG